jgi:hypothetical protein
MFRAALSGIGILGVAACGSSPAVEEMVDSCLQQYGTNPAYCECSADYTFAALDGSEAALMDAISSLPQGLSDREVAERLGMSPSDLRREMGSIRSRLGSRAREARNVCSDRL